MLHFSHGRLYEDEDRVQRPQLDQTAANSLITIGTFMSALLSFRDAIGIEVHARSSLTLKTCLTCIVLLAINVYRVLHRRGYVPLTLPKSLLVATLFIGEQFLFIFLIFFHHFMLSRYVFVASLDSRDRLEWIFTSLVFLQLVPLRAAILWPLPLSWNSKNVSRDPLRRALFRVCQFAFSLSIAITLLSWCFFLLCPNSFLIRILQLPPRLISIELAVAQGGSKSILPPIFFIYHLGMFLLSFMDRRCVHLPSFRLREELKVMRAKLEGKRTRKVGLVRKFIHIARSGVTILQYYVDELGKAILELDDDCLRENRAGFLALRSLQLSIEKYRCVIDRLSAEFESDFIRRSDSLRSMSGLLRSVSLENESDLASTNELPKLRLILAEDDTVIQTILRGILEPHCRSIVIVDNGLELVRTVVREKANIRSSPSQYCIVTDINMPIVDGKVAVSMIRTLPFAADLPIIALTGTAITEANWVEKYGFDKVILKPFQVLTLYRDICEVWSHSSVIRRMKSLSLILQSQLSEPKVQETDLKSSLDDDTLRISPEKIIQISQSSLDKSFRKNRIRVNLILAACSAFPLFVVSFVSRKLYPALGIINIAIGFLNQACGAILPLPPGFISNLVWYSLLISTALGIDGLLTTALFIAGIYVSFLRISDRFNGWHSDFAVVLCVLVSLHSYFVIDSPHGVEAQMIRFSLSSCGFGISCIVSTIESIRINTDDEKERDTISTINREIGAASRAVFQMTESVTHDLGNQFEVFHWALCTIGLAFPPTNATSGFLSILHQTYLKVSSASRSLAKYCRFEKGIRVVENSRVSLRQFVFHLLQETLNEHQLVEVLFMNEISDSAVVMSDVSCLIAILSSLVSNAVTHGNSDRGLKIRTTATETECGEFFIFRFAVRDFGCGMTKEEIHLTLQDPFCVDVEVADPTLNRGITLYLTFVLAKEMNGSIDLTQPTDGEGGLIASFACRFKRTTLTECPKIQPIRETDLILIIDDCFAVREMLTYHLTQLEGIFEHNVTQLTNQNELFELIRETTKDFTITFLDDHLIEGSTGLDLARQAKQEGWLSRLGVVCLMSGVGVDLRSLEEEEELSGCEFRSLMKPISPFELREVIQ